MKWVPLLVTALALFVAPHVRAQQKSTTAAVVHAADSFIATLTVEQRQKLVYPFNDARSVRNGRISNRRRRAGRHKFKQMTVAQQQAAIKLMGTVLSPMDLEKVNEIRQADEDFKANGSKRGSGGGGPRPQGPDRADRADLSHSLPGAHPAALVGRVVPVVVHRAAICSVPTCTTFRFLERLP